MMFCRLVCISLLISLVRAVDDTTSERDILNRLLDPTVYDATIRPGSATGGATRVELDLDIKSLGPVNDIDMEFSSSFFLRQQWVDKRLVYDDIPTSIIIGYKRLESIWVPDLFFPNSREETRHFITTPNVMIRLYPNGTIMYSQRISVTLLCQMDLSNFPMDTQTCRIDMESYGFPKEYIYFAWSSGRNATLLQPEVSIPDFTVIGTSTGDCSKVYSTGNFTCLRAVIHLKRETGFYAIQTYIPSVLIVILSWASFWIEHEAVPARVSVGLLTVLTITTQSSGVLSQLPRVPYIKAIDVWLCSCLLFVFAAYMEFAVVIVLSRKYKKSKGENLKAITKIPAVSDNNNYPSNDSLNIRIEDGIYVDKLSRMLFPCAFVIFNLIYWVYYKRF